MPKLPRVACLCPTYGHPRLLRNALACFNAQTYPRELRSLIILDDLNQIGITTVNAEGITTGWSHVDNWDNGNWCGGAIVRGNVVVETTADRYRSLPHKYERLELMSEAWSDKPDIYVVWDDDDVYLPMHVASHVNALKDKQWSQPENFWGDCDGPLKLESTKGRMHGSIAVRREAAEELGGWLGVMEGADPRRADFDQRFIAACEQRFGSPGRPRAPTAQYIYRWGSTGASHCSAAMKTPDNTDWYTNYKPADSTPQTSLDPEFDKVTVRYYQNFKYHAAIKSPDLVL